LVDDISFTMTHQKKLDLVKFQLDNNLSELFEKLGGSVIMSGPTGTNVMDVQIALLNTSTFERRE